RLKDYPRKLVFRRGSCENGAAMRGRNIAIVLGILVLASIAGAAVFARGAIVERWYIYRLHSDHEATRLAAERALADRKSLAAVPHLMEAINDDVREKYIQFGPPNLATYVATPLSHALFRIGVASPIPVIRMLNGRFQENRRFKQMAWFIESL